MKKEPLAQGVPEWCGLIWFSPVVFFIILLRDEFNALFIGKLLIEAEVAALFTTVFRVTDDGFVAFRMLDAYVLVEILANVATLLHLRFRSELTGNFAPPLEEITEFLIQLPLFSIILMPRMIKYMNLSKVVHLTKPFKFRTDFFVEFFEFLLVVHGKNPFCLIRRVV